MTEMSPARPEVAMSRIGAVLLPASVVLFIVATAVWHPHREDPMAHHAVFLEYAESSTWIAVHFAQWVAALSLCSGLIALSYTLAPDPRHGAEVAARFGRVGSVLTAAAFTMLQAVDGVALKWAVDAWAATPPAEQPPLFAAAMALRWTEYALQSYSNLLLGLTLLCFAAAIGMGTRYPRWFAWVATGSGAAWIMHGGMVAQVGLFDSLPRLAAILLLAGLSFGLAFPMWHAGRAARNPPGP